MVLFQSSWNVKYSECLKLKFFYFRENVLKLWTVNGPALFHDLEWAETFTAWLFNVYMFLDWKKVRIPVIHKQFFPFKVVPFLIWSVPQLHPPPPLWKSKLCGGLQYIIINMHDAPCLWKKDTPGATNENKNSITQHNKNKLQLL